MGQYALRLSDDEVARYQWMAQRACEAEAELWPLAGISAGADVVDVGCGPGAILVALAEVVGPDGSVTGVDANADAVDRADALIAAKGLRQASAQWGRADATGLDAGTYDVAVLRHVLAHNGGHEQAIVDHLATLVRPGGCVYLVDIEATMSRIRPPVPEVIELLERYHAFHAAQGNDLQVGLRLADLLCGAGLEVVEHRGQLHTLPWQPGLRGPAWAARESLVAAGFATPDDLARWDAAFTALDASEQRPTMFLGGFVAIGRRD
ncbi:MAG: methyltransferase domain-containing protein [Actinomycetota bacterium]|nr:methyltransferase domain-containing protein [Actinomycetota bacterium]